MIFTIVREAKHVPTRVMGSEGFGCTIQADLPDDMPSQERQRRVFLLQMEAKSHLLRQEQLEGWKTAEEAKEEMRVYRDLWRRLYGQRENTGSEEGVSDKVKDSGDFAD